MSARKTPPANFRFFAAVGKVYFVLGGTEHYSTIPNKSQQEGGILFGKLL